MDFHLLTPGFLPQHCTVRDPTRSRWERAGPLTWAEKAAVLGLGVSVGRGTSNKNSLRWLWLGPMVLFGVEHTNKTIIIMEPCT